MSDQPRRRKTDTWNGRFRQIGSLIPWLFVLAGWAYTLGANGQRLNAVESSLIAAEARIEVLRDGGAVRAAELARLAEAIDNLEETIRELRTDIRQQARTQ